MSERLVTASRDALIDALSPLDSITPRHKLADSLIDSGVVRVIDPADPELVERVAAIVVAELQLVDANPERLARAAIEAVLR